MITLASLKSPRLGTRRTWALPLAGALILGLGACTKDINVRGNIPVAEDLERIAPGVHTRNDVARLLGSPSSVSTFKDSKWYYIGQKTSDFAFFAPEVLERSVVVVSFDPAGMVAETKLLGLKDSRDIDPIDRITPTEGRKPNFLSELFGNIGRFNSGDESN